MINILPQSARSSLKFEYRLRLFALACKEGALFCTLAVVVLLPAYFNVEVAQRAAANTAALARQAYSRHDLTDSAAAEDAAQRLLAAAQANIAALRPTVVIAALAAARPAGVTLTNIEFSAQGNSAKIQLDGTADTRGHLLAYKQALVQTAGVDSVLLPVENLITATAAPFSITVTYTPPPTSL